MQIVAENETFNTSTWLIDYERWDMFFLKRYEYKIDGPTRMVNKP